MRLLYRADGLGRKGIRFLVARQENEIAVTRGEGDVEPAYDRRGGWVYFVTREGGNADLGRVRLSGDERTVLTRTTANETWPAVSPDGTTLFYTSDEGGSDQIYRSAPDGTGPVAVTRGPEPHSRVAVDSTGRSLIGLEGDSTSARLVRIEVATGAVTAVEGVGDLAPAGRPALRGDGSIAYACRVGAATDICRVGAGGAPVRLTQDAARDRDPVWSPEGRALAWSSDRDGKSFELYLMRADGSRVRRLTKEKGADVEPVWVP